MTLVTIGITQDTFPKNCHSVFTELSTTSDPDKSNFSGCLDEFIGGGGIIFGSAWRNIAAIAAVSVTRVNKY